jgi:hypothetical protein
MALQFVSRTQLSWFGSGSFCEVRAILRYKEHCTILFAWTYCKTCISVEPIFPINFTLQYHHLEEPNDLRVVQKRSVMGNSAERKTRKNA